MDGCELCARTKVRAHTRHNGAVSTGGQERSDSGINRVRVLVLGSTGSIGTQALEVIAANPDRFEVVGLAGAGTNVSGAIWCLGV